MAVSLDRIRVNDRFIMCMKHLLVVALLVALLGAGCKKNEPPPPPPPPTTTLQSGSEPSNAGPTVPPPASPVVAPNTTIDTSSQETTLNQLTFQLRRYIGRTRSRPASFEDFAARSQLQVPPPPPGKKYAISRDMKVILVKN
jgi:hypothetical protein